MHSRPLRDVRDQNLRDLLGQELLYGLTDGRPGARSPAAGTFTRYLTHRTTLMHAGLRYTLNAIRHALGEDHVVRTRPPVLVRDPSSDGKRRVRDERRR